jgi:hypothetical protein
LWILGITKGSNQEQSFPISVSYNTDNDPRRGARGTLPFGFPADKKIPSPYFHRQCGWDIPGCNGFMEHFRDDQELVWVFFGGIGLRFSVFFILFCVRLMHKIYFVISDFSIVPVFLAVVYLHLRMEFRDHDMESFPVLLWKKFVK